MSSFSSIFKVVNGELDINKQEVREIPEYKKLITRDKGSDGDYDGRKKQIARKELLYIYLILDPRSMYYALDKETRKEKAEEHCDFPDKWKPDEAVQNAARRYKEDMQLTASAQSYLASEKALYSVGKDAEFFQEQLAHYKRMLVKRSKFLLTGNIKDKSEEEINQLLSEAAAIMKEVIGVQDKLLKNIEKIPNLQDTVTKLAAKYMEEEGGKKNIYGGGQLGNREK